MSYHDRNLVKHIWFKYPKFHPLVTCQKCGVVKRTDGKNKPCPGKIRVELRDNRLKPESIMEKLT